MSNQALTAVSQYQTMHEDVPVRAEDKHASRSSKQGRVHQRTPLGFQREHLSSASWRMVEHTASGGFEEETTRRLRRPTQRPDVV